MLLELLKDNLKKSKRVLDVGCGSGYLTAMMTKLMEGGFAYGVDHIPEIVDLANENVMKNNSKLKNDGKLIFVKGDGRKGLEEHAPFDVINVGGSVSKIPRDLMN
jgi:protein-L-isoaspartate(D-aspartate) O-methyltransferase